MVDLTRTVASHALRAYVPGKLTRSVLSILCIISAGVIGAVGVVCFIFCSINPRNVIINIYLIIFAVLIILSELGFSFLLKRFSFLDTFFGRGVFYIFVGLLAVDTHWFQILAGVFVAAYGLVLVFMSFFVDSKLSKSPFSRQDNTQSNESHPATTDESIPDRIQGTSNV
ncbi:hypothetical protein Gasu2_40240 [Galdieria sulphuraria]|uniref:COPI associated protein n=1 Tax=Galdieria sulphuraria TaxID=130081 RepID=M2XVB0_GALSU|nr:hypothetical protein Gasu_48920 isoform 2 [Galdieria sulphuraria]XP_005704119.1 hypothetical protein Gasu_48920 isoform 1 [Galdieria sulphuraria]EME27598.1 hypothetical protein isoform 2 [Galdieria sulphuraria]EME27599.1 hypothetical protein isoform 1 [Galdieria sulphuraria]GJD09793.1 hypothetical protein Gasu2_40240 [Galdieria sulphuraria]|eukprot:XP_005704118.1 hypothetical protein isoform 2 [Galdieria sulphuraria]